MAGLYIHIPFCKQACHYCNFHFSTSLAYKERMVSAINREIEIKAPLLTEEIETIYFGGGTPSLLDAKEIDSILSTINSNFKVALHPEITLETNPDDVDEKFIETLHNSSINRLSMGIQSFFQEDLDYMNRAHNADEGRKALESCFSAGIKNITADLIYGVPTLTNARWIENIHILKDYQIPHLSCYQLTVEDKTPLEAFIERGKLAAPSDEQAIDQYYILLDIMQSNGYEAYEISNYAKPGFRSRHNSSYWQGKPYLGFGPSAHSFYENCRTWNTVVNNRYMEEIERGRISQQKEELTQANQYNEFILTRLRTIEGISISKIQELFPEFIVQFSQQLISPLSEKLIERRDDNIILTHKGKVWADAISAGLMVE